MRPRADTTFLGEAIDRVGLSVVERDEIEVAVRGLLASSETADRDECDVRPGPASRSATRRR